MNKVVILKTGTYTDAKGRRFVITPAILKDLAESTPPMSAPLVKGHPEGEAPAMAWVNELSVEGGRLKAGFGAWNQDFEQEVLCGAYRNISASFFLPDTPSNPKPGHYVLRHAAALGAVRPAVPGLGTLQDALGLRPMEFSLCGEEGVYKRGRFFRQGRITGREPGGDWAAVYVEAEIAQWAELKEIGESLRQDLKCKALRRVEEGSRPGEAVAAFAEPLPDKRGVRFGDRTPGKGAAAFSEGEGLVWGSAFALKKAEYEKKGLSGSLAYDKARRDMEDGAEQ